MPPDAIATARRALTAALSSYTALISPATASRLAEAKIVYEALTGIRIIPGSPVWSGLIQDAIRPQG